MHHWQLKPGAFLRSLGLASSPWSLPGGVRPHFLGTQAKSRHLSPWDCFSVSFTRLYVAQVAKDDFDFMILLFLPYLPSAGIVCVAVSSLSTSYYFSQTGWKGTVIEFSWVIRPPCTNLLWPHGMCDFCVEREKSVYENDAEDNMLYMYATWINCDFSFVFCGVIWAGVSSGCNLNSLRASE